MFYIQPLSPVSNATIWTPLCSTFLPHMPELTFSMGSTVYPIAFGGMVFQEIHSLQLAIQLRCMIKQFFWNRTVANNLQVTINSLQLHQLLTNQTCQTHQYQMGFFLNYAKGGQIFMAVPDQTKPNQTKLL